MNPERAEAYRRLREGPRIFQSTKDAAWVLTRYADVSSILRHPSAQAIQYGQFFHELDKRGNLGLTKLRTGCLAIPLFLRPPRHDDIRRIIAQLLGNFRRTGLPESLSGRVDSILSSGHAKGEIELVREFGREIALCSIASILGLPAHELARLVDEGSELIVIFDRFPPSINRLKKLNCAAEFVLGYFADAIAERRKSGAPVADGLSLLMRQAEETGACSDDDIAGFCSFFFFAGVLTTAAALSDCALCLLSDSELRERLVREPSLLPSFAREILRLSSPVKYISREMRDDTEIAGTTVRSGDHVVLMLDVANRDSEVFPNPDVLDMSRDGPEPLTFAAGPYRCLGGQLATFEVELAAKKLLEWPSLRWSPHELEWQENANIAGLRYLHGHYGSEGSYGGK
jgi:cytochrome P450